MEDPWLARPSGSRLQVPGPRSPSRRSRSPSGRRGPTRRRAAPRRPRGTRATFTPPTAGPAAAIAADLAAIHAEPDAAKQRAAILALFRTSRDALFALEAGTLAALAPDVLRVYDLAGALASGGDGELPAWWTFPDVPDATWPLPEPTPTAAVVRRATRIAGAAADRVKPPTIAAPTFVDVWTPSASRHDPRLAHACVVVLGGPDDLERVEAMLDHVATVGGRSYAVTVDVLASAALTDALGLRALGAGASRDATGLALPSAAVRAAHRVARFALPTPAGRRATAWRAADPTYVQDWDLHARQDEPATFVRALGVLRTGIGATSEVIVDARGADAALTVDVRAVLAASPLPTFTTTLTAGGPPVTIEIPKLERAVGGVTRPDDGARSSHVVRLGVGDLFALVDVEPTATTPTSRGWARVAAGAPPVGVEDARPVEFTFACVLPGHADPVRGGLAVLPGQEAAVVASDGPAADGSETAHEIALRCDAAAADGARTVDVVVGWRSDRRGDAHDAERRRRDAGAAPAPGRPHRRPPVPLPARARADRDGARLDADGRPAFTLTCAAPTPLPAPEHRAGLASPQPTGPVPVRPSDAALAAVRAATGPERTKAVLALRAASEAGFLQLSVDELAALAPDVLHVYDVSAALADGEDAPTPPAFDLAAPAPSMDVREAPAGGEGQGRAARIASRIEPVLANGFALVRRGAADGGTPGGTRTVLVVCAPDERFGEVEQVLERLATTGGPVVRLEVDVVRPCALAGLPTTGTLAPEVVPTEATLAAARLARYELDVPYGRTVSAWRHVRHAYVADVEVDRGEAGPRPVGPVIGAWAEGLGLVAQFETPGDALPPKVALAVSASFGIRPVQRFTTPLEAWGWQTVTIELPELAVRTVELGWLVPPAGVVAVDTVAPGGLAVLVRARPVDGGAPIARGWARVDATPGAAAASPRVTLATLAATWRGADGRALTSPRVTVYLGQAATVSVSDERSYIAGATVTGSGTHWVVEPVVDVLSEGFALEATVRPGLEGEHVVDGRILRTHLDAPMREIGWNFGTGAATSLQLPVAREVSRPFRARLRVGGSTSIPVPAIPGAPTATLTLTLEDVHALDDPAPATR